jgi:hypothetical protein
MGYAFGYSSEGIGFLNVSIDWLGRLVPFFYERKNQGNSWEFKPSIGSIFNRFQRVNDTLIYTSGIHVCNFLFNS